MVSEKGHLMRRCTPITLLVVVFFGWAVTAYGEPWKVNESGHMVQVPILLYHRFGPAVADGMTVTTGVFESHLKYFKDHGYTVIPLRELVDYLLKGGPPPGNRSVAITADDGHRSVYSTMFPILKRYRVPVTLFLYPSAISNASYAMTWDELREMKGTGLFDFQSHTYWHPDFRKEKKKLKPEEYEKFLEMQLKKSKEKLEEELNVKVTMLAWPFGIYDDELIKKAVEAGYLAGFTMERHLASLSDNIMALPRYLMVNTDKPDINLERILARGSAQG
jgi:peptidoglycan/xylan/chitin deacetylase (PgdA/CDA1 family)